MKKMLKRADGSKSRRGLWDNIRAKAAANKKSGKKGKAPSKDMLEQEAKIKAEMKMGGQNLRRKKKQNNQENLGVVEQLDQVQTLGKKIYV